MVPFVGVLITRALLLGVYIRNRFLETPMQRQQSTSGTAPSALPVHSADPHASEESLNSQ